MDFTSSSSSEYFPLLAGANILFLKQILEKMQPSALSAVRELSPTVDYILMKEAKKSKIVAEGAQIIFNPEGVQIYRQPEGFYSTSLLFHKSHSNCTCSKNSLRFWDQHIEEMPAVSAMSHLAGSVIPRVCAEDLSDAQDLIDDVSQFEIGVQDLTLVACSAQATSQLLSHFKPTRLAIEHCDDQKVEEIVVEHIYGEMDEIRLVCDGEYPDKIVEEFLRCFQKGEAGLRRLVVQFPARKIGQNPFLGMECRLLNNFQQGFAMLLRTDSSSPRHVLLRGELEFGQFSLDYTRIASADDLPSMVFGSYYGDCPDIPILGLSHYSPSELRDIIDSPKWDHSA